MCVSLIDRRGLVLAEDSHSVLTLPPLPAVDNVPVTAANIADTATSTEAESDRALVNNSTVTDVKPPSVDSLA